MKKSLMLIVTLSFLMIPAYSAFADDADSQMHNAVSNKVQADHKADLEAGHGHIQKASGGSSSSSSTGKTTTVSGPAVKPMQIQQLKKKKGTPPPPPKTTGH
jgi:hypothetical protein